MHVFFSNSTLGQFQGRYWGGFWAKRILLICLLGFATKPIFPALPVEGDEVLVAVDLVAKQEDLDEIHLVNVLRTHEKKMAN